MDRQDFNTLLGAIERIDEKCDKLSERMSSVDKTLIGQHAVLDHHVYRTDLAEARMEKHENATSENFEKMEQKIEPIQKHVNYVHGGIKLITLISLITGTVYGIYKFFI